jgi:hypothetical protein
MKYDYVALAELWQQYNLSQYYCSIHKSHMSLPGIEPVCNASYDRLINPYATEFVICNTICN